MAFGMIILDIILRFFLIEKKVARKWAANDRSDAEIQHPKPQPPPTTLTTSPPAGLLPVPQTQTTPSSPPNPPSPPTITTKKPIPAVLTLLKSRRLLAALFCTLAQATLTTAWDAVLPLYTNNLFNFSSLGAGLIFLPLMIPSFIAPLIGYWADKRRFEFIHSQSRHPHQTKLQNIPKSKTTPFFLFFFFQI